MSILQMQRINICALKKSRKAILERLQEMGAIEIDIQIEDENAYEKQDVSAKKSDFDKKARLLDQAVEILQRYVPEKKGMLSSLEGKPLIDRDIYEKAIQCQDAYVRKAEDIVELDRRLAEEQARIQNLQNQMDALIPWMGMDVPMNYQGTKKTAVLIGSFPGNIREDEIQVLLMGSEARIEAVEIQVLYRDKDFTYVFVICLKQEVSSVEDILRMSGFARPAHICDGIPAECKQDFLKKIQESLHYIESLKMEIGSYERERDYLRMVSDYYRLRSERYAVVGNIPQTKNTFVLSGYIPEKDAQKIGRELSERYGAMVEIEGLKEDEEAPVLLKNNGFAEAGEGVLASFGLPKAGDIDPTAIMTAFYVFLFGLMLADVAYGLIVALACGIALKKYPRMEQNLRKSLKLFFLCGLSTIFWGIMFGGYFGDAINIISNTFLGKEITIPALWFAPLEEPMRMLLWSIIFGMIHMYTGLALKAYVCIKNKRYMDAVCDVGFWFLLLTGLILMLAVSDLFVSMFQVRIVLPAAVNLLAKAMAIAGAAGIVLMSGRDKKNKWGIRIALGAYDLYNITGWLSDALSYSRLLALGLATGVIASVFNQMGSMFGDGILGTIVFVIVFIIGHIFNLALNLLGTYVHTCRLQYIEFFGKFYEGGGRAFNPFRPNTKYVDIKEEI